MHGVYGCLRHYRRKQARSLQAKPLHSWAGAAEAALCCAVLCAASPDAWWLRRRAASPKHILLSLYNFRWFNWFVFCVPSHTLCEPTAPSIQLSLFRLHIGHCVEAKEDCYSRFAVSSICANYVRPRYSQYNGLRGFSADTGCIFASCAMQSYLRLVSRPIFRNASIYVCRCNDLQ